MLSASVRRIVMWATIAALIVALYAALGFFAVPRILRSQLQEFTTEHYGRSISLGEIRFNPFKLALEMRDVALPDSDRQPMLAFKRLFVNIDIASLWRRGASFQEIALEQPFARTLIRPDGSLNLVDLAKPFADEAPPKEKEEPARLFIDKLSVTAGRALFEDRSRRSAFRAELRPITFELLDFSTTGKTGNTYSLSGASAAGERFSWNGAFGLNPLASKGQFEVTALQARTVWNYLRDSLGFEIASGVIGLAGNYDFSTAQEPLTLKVNVSRLGITDLGLRPRGSTDDYVKLASIEIAGTTADVTRQTVTVEKVRVAGGDIRAWRDAQGALNLQELAGPAPVAAAAAATAGTTDAATTTVAVPAAEPATDAPATGASAKATPAKTASSKAESPWVFSAPDISIEGLKITAEDRSVTPVAAFNISPLNAHVSGYTTAPDAGLDLTTDLKLTDSGTIKAQAKVSPDSGALTAQLEVADVDLADFQPYIAQQTSMTLLSGSLGTKLSIERSANGALEIKGDTDVGKLRTVDNALKKDFIKWDRLRLGGIHYKSEPASLRIESIRAQGPYARVIIAADQSLNVTKVLSPATNAPPPPAPPSPLPPAPDSPMPISIGTVQITNGSANFADFWIQPNYAVSLQSLNGSINGLSSNPASRAKLKLEGKVDRYAPAHIDGEVNLLAATVYSDVRMNFKGVDLSSVTPYSGRFAGYKIEKGKLSLDVTYHVDNRKLKADHKFIIDQLQLGERVESPDAVKLPLRLAVALLKDRNGVIDLDLPVGGSLDDPKFRIGPIIWKAVLNLLTKIVTAPFAMLGKLFGGSEEMNLIEFDPGSAALNPAANERLASLLKALKERPQLQLDVPGAFAPNLDRPVLVQRRLQEQLLALNQTDKPAKKRKSVSAEEETALAEKASADLAAQLADPAERYRLLTALYRQELGKDAPLPPAVTAFEETKKRGAVPTDEAIAALDDALTARIEVAESDLEDLGRQRAQAVQEVLLGSGEVDTARLFVINAPPISATGATVRLEMSLK